MPSPFFVPDRRDQSLVKVSKLDLHVAQISPVEPKLISAAKAVEAVQIVGADALRKCHGDGVIAVRVHREQPVPSVYLPHCALQKL